MNKEITLIITACDRLDLLERTINSFVTFNTFPIAEMIIRDDCGLPEVQESMKELLLSLNLPFDYRVLSNEQVGQAKSIDLLMKEVKTPYVFHCEDDWEFYKPGFMEKSLEILKNDEMISHVWIRPPEGMNHPVWMSEEKNVNGVKYHLVKRSEHTDAWSFNPHLARMKDYIKPYQAFESEGAIGRFYKALGFETAWLIEGYVRHIGGDKSTYRPGTPYREGARKL